MDLKNRRIAAIHDISGFGRGSLTAAIATLSAMGFQTLPFPTAVLSSHTGIPGYTFHDLTSDFDAYIAHWKSLNLKFDAIYSGFLGSVEQTALVSRFIDEFRDENTIVLVDPVMGDGGKRYKTCSEELCEGMKELVKKADIITPNLTEAGILVGGWDLNRLPRCERCVKKWLLELAAMGPSKILITGMDLLWDQIAVACYDAKSETTDVFYNDCVDEYFPGTGDLFASVFLGAYLQSSDLVQSAKKAACFVKKAAELTVKSGENPIEGVLFEKLLPELMK
ncbi:MAG: pyridoxamine kinase [Clostridiales bacterium]|nr:pyridoxamine kinase [Clostridiales bacterium]